MTHILPSQYDWGLVALSVAIAVCASYTALDLAGRVTGAKGHSRTLWLAGGATAFGLGIWAMHYIGMLAFKLPIPVSYNVPMVAFSLLAAIAASLVALVVVSRQNLGNGYLAGGSVIMGGGIAGMHYSGMMAMQLAARPVYNPLLVALSVLIAVVVAGAALYLTFRLRHNDQSPVWLRLAAAAIMGLAIASMHYTGMAAVSFQHAPMNAPANLSVSVSSVGVVGIATLTFAVLALSLIASMADRVFSRQKQTLDAEQARWRLLIDANFDGIFDSNRLTGEVFYSPRWQAILGYGPNELEPKIEAWRRLIYPEDKDRVLAALEEHYRTRQGPVEMEYRLRHKDGSWRWVVARAHAIWDEQGRAIRLVGSHSDISARKESEEKVRSSERRYHELFENSPIPNWIYRIGDLRIIDVNQAAIDTYGWTHEEFLTLSVADIRLPGEAQAVEDALADCAANFRRMKPIRHRRNNRSEIWVGLSSYEIDVGGCRARLIQANDITARIEAEQQIQRAYDQLENLVRQRTAELEEKKAQWHGLVEALPQFVWTTTPDGACNYISKQWSEYSGAPVEELLGYGWLKMVHPDDHARIQAYWQAAAGTDRREDMEYRIRAKDGSYRWFMSRGRAVRATEGGPIIEWLGTSTDIDDQKRGSERLEAAVAERTAELGEALVRAEQATRAKSEFLAVMSHEIRTPMNGVIGMAHLLADTSLNAEQRGYLNTIRSSGTALLAIINEVLDFSKIEAGKLTLESSEFELRNILDESLRLVSANASAKGLRLSVEVEEAVPSIVVGDAGRLRQVLLNLLSNAVKFTERGGVSLHVSREAFEEAAVRMRFLVRDSGIGISAEQQSGLFEAFTQADTSTTRRFGGTGLGLSIAKRLVELMDGTIGLTSELGQGSTFWFTVRLALGALRAGDAPWQSRVLQPAGNSASLKDRFADAQARILLADDNITNQQVALGILKTMGLRADAVADGSEVLAALEGIPYDLIFMDVRMPNMDGLEATRRIRAAETAARKNRLPIIAMTAGAMDGDREKCLEAGMDDYITKPVDPREMAESLQNWLPKGKAVEADAPAVFDMPTLLSRLMGDKNLVKRVVDGFLSDMPRQLEALAKFVEAGSAAAIEDQAHRIKGAAANVGAEAMRAVALEMEQAGESGAVEIAQARMPDLTAQFIRLKDAIANSRHAEMKSEVSSR